MSASEATVISRKKAKYYGKFFPQTIIIKTIKECKGSSEWTS